MALIVFTAFFLCCFGVAAAQAPIPAEYDGFAYGAPPPRPWGGKALVVEAFFDPLCPDSRDAWPPLKRALHNYFPRLALVLHPFPVPYKNGWSKPASSRSEKFYNAPTHGMSRRSITDEITKLAVVALGNSSKSAFQSGFRDVNTDRAARVSFKYGCLRGVTGTPFFFMNGFPLPSSGSALDYNQWRSIIDPLMEEQREKEKSLVSFE